MAARVKLCAIAKNEGAYLADWVFHHLHFGFDAIEVWVNGTDDGSVPLLRQIAAQHPQVSWRRVDKLLHECLEHGKNFQRQAYARLARRAGRDSYSHVALLDLDEYWTPRDFTARVHDFLPEDPRVNVVSFPWCFDVPDGSRPAFVAPFQGPIETQVDRHVKSIARLDGSVRKFHEHTARTRRGVRLFLREPFPLLDSHLQRGGSFVPDEFLHRQWDQIPEAFVLHAINRSEVEYLATLVKGLRQTGLPLELKTNRYGYVQADGPVLRFDPPRAARAAYERRRRRFRRRTRTEAMTRAAEQAVLARAEALRRELVEAGPRRSELAPQLRGTSLW